MNIKHIRLLSIFSCLPPESLSPYFQSLITRARFSAAFPCFTTAFRTLFAPKHSMFHNIPGAFLGSSTTCFHALFPPAPGSPCTINCKSGSVWCSLQIFTIYLAEDEFLTPYLGRAVCCRAQHWYLDHNKICLHSGQAERFSSAGSGFPRHRACCTGPPRTSCSTDSQQDRG